MTLNDHLDALGAGLQESQRRADRRRRQFAVASLVGVATFTVGLGALVAVPGGRGLDPVEQARAALGPVGDLLHYELTLQQTVPGSKMPPPDPNAVGIAIWTATTGPDRYRVMDPADGRPTSCGWRLFSPPVHRRRMTGPALVSPTEFAVDEQAGATTSYSPFSQALVITEGQVPKGAGSRSLAAPGMNALPGSGADQRDPVGVVRAALNSGTLRDAGTLRGEDGRQLRRLVGELPLTKPETKPTQVTYIVDAATFVPVELRSRRWEVWSHAGGYDHWKWVTNITGFRHFERLPDTPANAKLLQIEAPASATVIRMDTRGHVISPKPLPGRLSLGRPSSEAVRACGAAKRR